MQSVAICSLPTLIYQRIDQVSIDSMEGQDDIRRIVVGLDFSVQHAKGCVDMATKIAQSATNREIILLTVLMNSDISDTEGRIDATKLKEVEGRAREMHERLVLGGGIFISQKVRSEFIKGDDVADAICEYCKRVDADLVIVGRRGMGFLKGLILGSVSEKVVRNSPCSVVVVK